MLVVRRDDVELARCPLITGRHPDLSMVDGLARLALTARRRGYTVCLAGASPTVWGLIELAGLTDVISRST